MSDQLTDRQKEVLEAIRELKDELGFSPSIREIADRIGVSSTRAVTRHLEYLEKKDAIERTPGIPRSIRVTA